MNGTVRAAAFQFTEAHGEAPAKIHFTDTEGRLWEGLLTSPTMGDRFYTWALVNLPAEPSAPVGSDGPATAWPRA